MLKRKVSYRPCGQQMMVRSVKCLHTVGDSVTRCTGSRDRRQQRACQAAQYEQKDETESGHGDGNWVDRWLSKLFVSSGSVTSTMGDVLATNAAKAGKNTAGRRVNEWMVGKVVQPCSR